MTRPIVLIRGAGEQASGTAVRLFRAGYKIVLTELPEPLAIRRTVAFSEAVFNKICRVEDIVGRLITRPEELEIAWENKQIPIFIDPNNNLKEYSHPEVIVDAIMAKRNTGTGIDDASLVIALGPGFTAGSDVHAVVETNRGHFLGRVYWSGSAQADTGIPGDIVGARSDRVIHCTEQGRFKNVLNIGDHVNTGTLIGYFNNSEITATLSGTIRGLLRNDIEVQKNTKIVDIDPRDKKVYCDFVSDKALAIGGGVLEAISVRF